MNDKKKIWIVHPGELFDIDKNFMKGFLNIIFEDNMWLDPTTKNK